MKPTVQIKDQRSPHKNGRREQRSFPLTDCSYQATAEAVESSTALAPKKLHPPHLHAFWKISADYFSAEANRHYATEAILFACISASAAWPVAVTIRQLLTMMI